MKFLLFLPLWETYLFLPICTVFILETWELFHNLSGCGYSFFMLTHGPCDLNILFLQDKAFLVIL